MKRLKLLTIGHSYVVSLNRSLMRELHRRGAVDVTVVTPRFFSGDLRPLQMEEEPAESSLRVIGVDAYVTSKIHLFFYNWLQLKKIFQENWDYAYLWEEPYIVSGFQMGKILNSQKIKYSLFTNQNIFKNYPWPFSSFERWTLNHCDSLWGCGPQVLETFRQKKYQGDAQIVPYFVNTDRFKPQPWSDKKELTVGFMGRLTPEKGVWTFLNALKSVEGQKNWKGLILGDGPLREEIKKWLSIHRLEGRVEMRLVPHEQVPQILSGLDLLLCPSQTTSFWREQFGRMLIEAMASGVPVMASHSGEIPFVVGDAGWILPEKDQSAWNGMLQSLLMDSQKRFLMREKGLQRGQIFSIQNVAQQMESLLLERTQNDRTP